MSTVPTEFSRRDDLEELFASLVARWREETSLSSSSTKIILHPAYQRIIGLGPAVVPLILRELEQRPDHFFWALKSMTGEDPVPPADRGNLPKMREAWLAWAKEKGFEW